jgi:hypothetical protein
MKKIAPGKYAVMFGEKAATFEIVNYRGEIEYATYQKHPDSLPPIHHDFLLSPKDKQTVYFLSNTMRFYRDLRWRRKNESLKDFALRLISPPITILGSTLIRYNLKTGLSKVIWNSLDHYSILNTQEQDLYHKYDNFALRPAREWVKDGQKAQVDLIHANSIEWTSEGILLSMRNLNRIIMLSHDGKKILWSLGNHPDDTYKLPQGEVYNFYHQHHASILPSGDIMLIDNHIPYFTRRTSSRVVIIRRNLLTKEARIIWAFTPPAKFTIGTRGSAYYLPNGNIVSFFPNTAGFGSDFLFEIKPPETKAQGYIELSFNLQKKSISKRQAKKLKRLGIDLADQKRPVGGGNRALPLLEIGIEKRIDQKRDKLFFSYLKQHRSQQSRYHAN